MSRRARRPLAALFATALLLAALGPAAAQPQEGPGAGGDGGADAADASAKPVAIPGAEVADRSQQEQERIERVSERTRPDPAIAEIERQLVESAEEATSSWTSTARSATRRSRSPSPSGICTCARSTRPPAAPGRGPAPAAPSRAG